METTQIEQVARAILYEGYLLYPYRLSAMKNQQRWMVGSLHPESFCRARDASDSWKIQTECIVAGDEKTCVDVKLRFLQLVARGDDPDDADGWREAIERQIHTTELIVENLVSQPRFADFDFTENRRSRVRGSFVIDATSLGDGLYRVGVRIANQTPFAASSSTTHAEAQPHVMASTHALIGVIGGRFVSSIDPGESFRDAVSACSNVGLWPVLIGDQGSVSAMLAAPIILYDHPRVAAESPGDLFDATEIDEILTLRILTLTPAERDEMAAGDPRARALLQRTESLDENQRMSLHAVMRPGSVLPGDRVILRPRGRADAFDLLLSGQTATVATIERDFEDQVYVTVMVDDDPGKDLGAMGLPGHRFFFRADEVEPIARAGGDRP